MERNEIQSALAGSSLTDTGIENIDYKPVAVMPDVRVVKIGGQSVMDRGRDALFPIIEEVVAARKQGIPILLLAGGGTRARHIYSIASNLEMPTGVLAALGGYVPMQNARMLQMLLAKHGGIYIMTDDFEKLPLYIQLGCLPVMTGMPPLATGKNGAKTVVFHQTEPTQESSFPQNSWEPNAPSLLKMKMASTPTTPRRTRTPSTFRESVWMN